MLVLFNALFGLSALVALSVFLVRRRYRSARVVDGKKPVSVNYHFCRKCNYACKFCFHTQTNVFMLPLEEAKRGIKLLHEAGMEKINFAGGEPFIFADHLGELCAFSKKLGLAVSIVSNGSLIEESWFVSWGGYLDILAISCDSFNEQTNKKIGRGNGKHVEQVYKVADLCRKYDVKFKLNSVICKLNYTEDMNEHIAALAPIRWKVFQVLLIEGENSGDGSKRKAKKLLITKEEFDAFTARHSSQKSLVPESNEVMKDSYLILDEKMCFLNCQNGSKEPSQSILEVPVQQALAQSGFDAENFINRNAIYDWSKGATCGSGPPVDIEDMCNL